VSLCIGVFDGVHLGHQAVIAAGAAHARECGGSLVVVTFDPHPARVLRPENAPRLLTSTAHKLRLISELGVPYLLKVRFDDVFASTDPEIFIQALVDAADPLKTISVGHDWAFGKGRRGNLDLLRKLGEEADFQVTNVAAVLLDGVPISSTRIRRAVESGDLDLAAKCLGRPFSILGTVVRGDQIGRTIGFRTANLKAHNEQFPPNGVYAVRVRLDSKVVDGVANIGSRPTVASAVPERRLEVHLFDFEDDLYGLDLEATFVEFIRPERKFDGLDALRAQIAKDVATAKGILNP
jgi:riboflavin kinase/FMN adenylyltransferase